MPCICGHPKASHKCRHCGYDTHCWHTDWTTKTDCKCKKYRRKAKKK